MKTRFIQRNNLRIRAKSGQETVFASLAESEVNPWVKCTVKFLKANLDLVQDPTSRILNLDETALSQDSKGPKVLPINNRHCFFFAPSSSPAPCLSSKENVKLLENKATSNMFINYDYNLCFFFDPLLHP